MIYARDPWPSLTGRSAPARNNWWFPSLIAAVVLTLIVCFGVDLLSSARAQPAPLPPSLNDVLAATRREALASGDWYIINGITVANAVRLPEREYRVTAPLEFVDYESLQLVFEPGSKVYPTWTDPTRDVLRFVGCNDSGVSRGRLDTRAGPVRRWLVFERNQRGDSANRNRILHTYVDGDFADAAVECSGNELFLIDFAHLQSFSPAPALRIDIGNRTMQSMHVKDTRLGNDAAGPFLHFRNLTGARMSDIRFDGASTCWTSNGPVGNAGVLIEANGEIRQLVFDGVRGEATSSWHQFLIRAAPGVGVNLHINGGSFHQMRKLVQAAGVDLQRCTFRDVDAYSKNWVEQQDAAGVKQKVATWAIPIRPYIDCGRLLDCHIERVGVFTNQPPPGECNRVYRTNALPDGVSPAGMEIR